MPRRHRTATGGYVYHVLNRAVGRATIFETTKDYAAFEKVVDPVRKLPQESNKPSKNETRPRFLPPTWHSWGDVKADFASASLGGNCVVFNIGGNKYRLVTRILYPSRKVFILKVMTHAEYGEDKWKDECGCFEPPPQPNKPAKKKSRKPQRKGS